MTNLGIEKAKNKMEKNRIIIKKKGRARDGNI